MCSLQTAHFVCNFAVPDSLQQVLLLKICKQDHFFVLASPEKHILLLMLVGRLAGSHAMIEECNCG